MLQRCAAIVPSFATRAYVEDRASSTVTTALSAGVPLVADADITAAYSYLTAEAVVPARNSSQLAGVLRALRGANAVRAAAAIARLRERLLAANAAALLPHLVPRKREAV